MYMWEEKFLVIYTGMECLLWELLSKTHFPYFPNNGTFQFMNNNIFLYFPLVSLSVQADNL